MYATACCNRGAMCLSLKVQPCVSDMGSEGVGQRLRGHFPHYQVWARSAGLSWVEIAFGDDGHRNEVINFVDLKETAVTSTSGMLL